MYSSAAVAEEYRGALIIPIMDHAREEIGITTLRDPVEEIAPDDLTAGQDSRGFQMRPRPWNHLRAVKEHRVELRRPRENGTQQGAIATTDIDQRLEPGEVIRPDHGVSDLAHEADHRLIENLTFLRMVVQVFPSAHPKNLTIHGLSGLDDTTQGAKTLPLPPATGIARQRPHRHGMVGLEEHAERRQRERARCDFRQQSHTCQGSEQTVQRRRMRLRLLRQRSAGLLPSC
jgi:hypothetical protein